MKLQAVQNDTNDFAGSLEFLSYLLQIEKVELQTAEKSPYVFLCLQNYAKIFKK